MRLRYKKRIETKAVYFIANGNPYSSFEETYRNARRQGMYDTGYHYYIDGFGNVYEDRPHDVVASSSFEDSTSSIYVLLETEDRPTDCQRIAIADLLEILEDKYGIVPVHYR